MCWFALLLVHWVAGSGGGVELTKAHYFEAGESRYVGCIVLTAVMVAPIRPSVDYSSVVDTPFYVSRPTRDEPQ